MHSVNETIIHQQENFARLTPAYRRRLARAAEKYIRGNPHMADASNYWRGLSARHVIAASVEAER